ncbi:MAG: tail assembly protein [Patescibacteria group bacterium]|nr:tail assembly protein [Patescibacteria group bacterium]
MLKTIRLYGSLGSEFGRVHKLDVSSTFDAIRALSALHKGFRERFSTQHFRVIVDKVAATTAEELSLPSREIKFVPVVSGAGHGLGTIFAGVALMVVAAYAPEILGESLSGIGLSASTITSLGGMVSAFGASLILGGIAQVLSKPPQQQASNSYMISGPVNTTQEGAPVPILYGRLMIGSMVISANLVSYDIPIGAITTNTGNSTVTSSTGTTLGDINQSTYLGGT